MRRASPFTRLSRWFLAALGAGLASGAPLAAQTVSPSAAPAEWVRYAEGATATISEWLASEREPAQRFRAYLDATRASEEAPSGEIELRVWIAADGQVSRIAFTPFAHEAANADLRAAVVGGRLPPPPPDMRQPMRIAIQLAPASRPVPDAGSV